MRRSGIRHAVVLAVATWCSRAWAVDQVTVDRIRVEIARHAEANGETLEHFVNRVGSPLWHIESYVYQAEQDGRTAEDALTQFERFLTALLDPGKRQLLKCMGIRVPRDVDPAPTPIACAALRQRLGVR